MSIVVENDRPRFTDAVATLEVGYNDTMIAAEETMNVQDAAAALDGSRYGNEGSRELFETMKERGLVAAFGYSDDLVELCGAIDAEISAYGGVTFYVTAQGSLLEDGSDGDNPRIEAIDVGATPIEARLVDGVWRLTTSIPHATFTTAEDGELRSEGIVFALANVPGDSHERD